MEKFLDAKFMVELEAQVSEETWERNTLLAPAEEMTSCVCKKTSHGFKR
jgi:hypothetical protein